MLRRLPILALLLASCAPPPEPIASPHSLPLNASAQASVSPPAPAPARTVRYPIVMQTRPSGSNVITIRADGTRETKLEIMQNGRGPKVTTRLTLGADGTPIAFDATGLETMGTPIDEHFSMEGKRARWKSTAENGEKELAGPAFYLPLAPVPDLYGPLVTALRKAGGVMPLLPDGEARLERTGETTVRAGAEEKHLVGYAITGIELTPRRVWLEDDDTFFAVVDPWFSCIREGWEASIDPLVALQKQLDTTREKETSQRLTRRPPPAGLAFVHARVFDAQAKRWLLDHTVVIQGNRIKAVGPTKTTNTPAGAEVVDAAGKALVPGLWDMHVHLGEGEGVLHIASGVTTVRDLGNDADRLDDYKKSYDDGTTIGPRVLRAGFVEGRGEKAAASKITAETEAEARAAVEFYASRGYEQLKIYNSMKPELVPVLTGAAHAKGMRVSGHVPMHMRAEDAVRAGYDEINHINMLFLNFFIDKDTDTRTPLRFSIVAEKGPGLDLQSKPVKDFFALLITKKTVIDPTVNVFEALFAARMGALSPSVIPVASRLPVQLRRYFLTGGLPVPEGKDQLYKDALTASLKMIKALYDAKIPIVAGTDSLPGLMLHRELELYVAAGLPAGDVLQIATLGAARVMKRDKTSGTIAPGKDADLVLIDGDPLARIEEIRRVVTVVRGGVVFPSAELYQSMGVRPWQGAPR